MSLTLNVDNHTLNGIASTMRSLVKQTFITTEAGVPKVTVSIGATLGRDGDTLESMIYRADKLIYKSKSSGRNCVTIG